MEDHGFRLLLVNPAQVKALQGRKSDGRDAKRIAEYLQDGRLDPSFVPPHEIRQLRHLLRYRLNLMQQRGESHNQIRDLFKMANIKFSSVASKLIGVDRTQHHWGYDCGRGLAGVAESGKPSGKLRKKEKQIKESFKGCFNKFHRMLLKMQL